MVPLESELNSLKSRPKKNYVKNLQLNVFSNSLKLIFKNEFKFERDF
jgi:hypothetical protein